MTKGFPIVRCVSQISALAATMVAAQAAKTPILQRRETDSILGLTNRLRIPISYIGRFSNPLSAGP
jgi:hypothetical protein